MNVIGFHQGQFGDLCMSTVCARALKEKYPNCKLTFGINKKYESIKELFLNNSLIDDIYIWDNYDNWPSIKDIKHIETNNYDIVFNPMPQHTDNYWYNKYHQTEEACLMQNLNPPSNLQVSLVDYFSTNSSKNYICVCFLAGNRDFSKSLTLENAKNLCLQIEKKIGIKPIQIGLDSDGQYGSEKFSGSFIDSAKIMLESKLFITVDTCWAWISSGYSKKTIGLYSIDYYHNAKSSKNWQPINANAVYLEENNLNNINIERILNEIKNKLSI
jgi:hypothetical protein